MITIRENWTKQLGFIVLMVAASFLRLVNLDQQGLWYDEFHSLASVSGSSIYTFDDSDLASDMAERPAVWYKNLFQPNDFWGNFKRNITNEGHPPLYMVSLKTWTAVFGANPYNIRLFSVVLSIVTIFVYYELSKLWLTGPLPLLATAFLAFSPFHIFFAQEARNYTLSWFFISIALYTASRVYVKRDYRPWVWILWFAGVFGSVSSHYYTAILCFIIAIPLILQREEGFSVKKLILVSVPFLFSLIWVPLLVRQMGVHNNHWTGSSVTFTESLWGFVQGLSDMQTGARQSATPLEIALFLAVLCISVIFGFKGKPNEEKRTLLYFTSIVFLHGFVIYVLDLVIGHQTIMIPRYSAAISFILPLIICYGLKDYVRLKFLLIIPVLLLCCNASILSTNGERSRKQMIRETAQYITNETTEENGANMTNLVLVVPSGPTLVGLGYYLPDNMILASTNSSMIEQDLLNFIDDYDRIWLVVQNLGLDSEKLSKSKVRNLNKFIPSIEKVHFAGIDLYRIEE